MNGDDVSMTGQRGVQTTGTFPQLTTRLPRKGGKKGKR